VQNSVNVDVSAVIFNPIDDVTAISCIGSITANKRRDAAATGKQRSMKCIDFIAKQRVMFVSSFIASDIRRRDGEDPDANGDAVRNNRAPKVRSGIEILTGNLNQSRSRRINGDAVAQQACLGILMERRKSRSFRRSKETLAKSKVDQR